MQKIVAIGLILALTIPVGTSVAVPQETTYTRVIDGIVAHFGYIPEMAIMNGEEVRTLDALTLLRENAMPLPSSDVALPPSDAGFGVRQGANGCLIGALITAVRFSSGQALENESPAAGPGGKIPCGPGYAYGTGIASADVSPGVTGTACVNVIVAGSWLNAPSSCVSVPGGTAESQAGHTGFVDILIITPFFTYHIEQQFSGAAAWAPGPAGTVDVGVITVG